jgi:hypothetical protein
MTYINETSWNYRIEQRLEQLQSALGGGASEATQDQILISLVNQTTQLSNLLIAQSELLEQQSILLEQLKTTYSETLEVTVSGTNQAVHPAISSTYQTFELVAVDASFTAGSEPGDRYLVLERVRADNSVIGANWQSAAVSPGQSRGLTWARDAGNDFWSRVEIPQIPIPVASSTRWRIRNIGTPASNVLSATFLFRVYKA